MADKNLLDVHNAIVEYVELYPSFPLTCKRYTGYNNHVFIQDDITSFIEYPLTVDRAINNTKHTTSFVFHICIQADEGDLTLMVVPTDIKKYLEVYIDNFINSIFIYRNSPVYFDKEKNAWKMMLIGEIVWDDTII